MCESKKANDANSSNVAPPSDQSQPLVVGVAAPGRLPGAPPLPTSSAPAPGMPPGGLSTPAAVTQPMAEDILAALGSSHTGKQILVGFAAETNDLEENAKKKLEAKGIDLIVANDVSAENTGFDCDTNAVTLFDLVGRKTEFPLADKRDIAQAILDTALKLKVDRHEEIGEK